MKKHIRKKLKSTKGITLIALVITIIVLLILAGVSLSMVFSQEGIFSRAEQATDKHGQAKARETLELALGEAQMQKYEEGLTEEQLDNKIGAIEGELLPKEKPEYPNLQNVILDGYIFEIDRSVPKIVDYIGPADGVIITAIITGNNGWVKPGETVSVSGVIKTYSGGTITSSNAIVTKGSTTILGFPTIGGNYIINNISEDTEIKITATDSNGKSTEKIINIVIKRDVTAPTVETVTAEAESLKIKFSATGHDRDASGQEGSGIHHFNYTISSSQDTPLEGIPVDKRTGIFTLGQTVEIITTPTGDRDETTYTITVTAIDNVNNETESSAAKATDVTTIYGITLEQAKELINETNIKDYIGIRILDYTPDTGGIWRVYYYDENGKYGYQKELYLLSDRIPINNHPLTGHVSSDGGALMKKLNPMWANCNNLATNMETEYTNACSWISDPEVWKNYLADGVDGFCVGGPSIEMFTDVCILLEINISGLSFGANGSGAYMVSPIEPRTQPIRTPTYKHNKDWVYLRNIVCDMNICSPGYYNGANIWHVHGTRKQYELATCGVQSYHVLTGIHPNG